MKYKVTLELYNEKMACGQIMNEEVTEDYTRAYCAFTAFANALKPLMRDLEKCERKSYMDNLTLIAEVNEVEEDEWGELVSVGCMPEREETLKYEDYKAAKDAEEEDEED